LKGKKWKKRKKKKKVGKYKDNFLSEKEIINK